MPRPPVKRVKALATAQAYGEDVGHQKARKHVKIQDALYEKLLDTIDRIDPLQLAAILGLAYVYKTTLDMSQEWLENFTSLDVNFPLTKRLINAFSGVTGYTVPEGMSIVDLDLPNAFEWVLCFAFSYLTITHGEELKGGIVAFARGVLGK